MIKKIKTINREISWLLFNERLLQEAENETVPLLERIFFLGIFSSNLDEFFGVRVATLRRLDAAKLSGSQLYADSLKETLQEIKETVLSQLARFDNIYRQLIAALEEVGIQMVNEKEYTNEQALFVKTYFKEKVRPVLIPIMLKDSVKIPFIKDRAIYLGIKLSNDGKDNKRFALIEIPTSELPRFVVIPSPDNTECITMLDDLIRANIADVFTMFKFQKAEAFTFKLTRDSELDLDEDISKSLMEKIGKSLKQRKNGEPVRFVYDKHMPNDLLKFLIDKIKLKPEHNLIPGRRYHNFKDLMNFPAVGNASLRNKKMLPQEHPLFKNVPSLLKVIAKQDVLLAFPYQGFGYLVDLLREAAIDPKVRSIQINVYRLAKESEISTALINAVKNGKEVTVLVELQARFDEANNVKWADRLQKEGAKIIFGINGLKVHSKLILITRKEDHELVLYGHIGTGNFHEGNAKIYADYSLLTTDKRITNEIKKVFSFFENTYKRDVFRHLWVSPFNTRRKILSHIKAEIDHAKAGKKAYIMLKINNLVDQQVMQLLCDASKAGVKINLLVRGICCLVAGVKGFSENITVTGVIDRYLEHARVFVFGNNGDEKIFISSADLMPRNLDSRVEVTTPIYDENVKKILKDNLNIMLADNQKARIMDEAKDNRLVKDNPAHPCRSQYDIYDYFKHKIKPS
jgi:polyphosphate kinase